MADSRATIDSFMATLRGDDSEALEKVAYSRSDVTDTANADLLSKLAEDMNADEIVKQAAAARVSGNIMAEIILEKVASQLAPSVASAIHEKIASLLPKVVESIVPAAVELALQKIAVGTSSAISGNLVKSVANDGSANDVQWEEDRIGKGMKGKTDKYWGAEETSGASVSGGGAGALDGGAGDRPEGFQPVHKLSSARAERNQYLKNAEREKEAYLSSLATDPNVTIEAYKEAQVKAAAWYKQAEADAAAFLKKAEIEADLARYQELEQKKEAGALTPEEEQELMMLQQKLMAAANAAAGPEMGGAPGGAPGDAGPPGGGAPPPPGGGGMMVQASQKKANVDMVKTLLKKHGLIGK